MEILGLSGIYLLVLVLGALLSIQGFTGYQVPLLSNLVKQKKSSQIIGIVMVAGALVAGGAVSLDQFDITGDEEVVEKDLANFEVSLDNDTINQVSQLNSIDKEVTVEYYLNENNVAIYNGTDAELGISKFDAIINRIDTKTEDAVAEMKIVTNPTIMDEDSNSHTLVVSPEDEKTKVGFKETGGTMVYESETVLLEPSDSTTVTVSAEWNHDYLAEIDQYESTDSLVIEVAGETVRVNLLRVE